MGLAVLGLQQSSVWGWGSAITWVCIAAGLALLVAFVLFELRVANPLIRVRIFENAPSRSTPCATSAPASAWRCSARS
jgi:hypothetical protein